jgi:hypothetical protein
MSFYEIPVGVRKILDYFEAFTNVVKRELEIEKGTRFW